MVDLIETDNLAWLREQPDKSVPLLLADPWYGIGMARNDTTGFAKRRFRNEAFQDAAPPPEFFRECLRVGRKVWVWGGNYFLEHLGNCRGPYIWDKGTGANYFADGEMAWNNVLGCLRIFKHQWCGAFKDSERGDQLIHPCQKPAALYRDIITRSKLKPGDWILETNLGSGASAVAAIDLGFDYKGLEIDPDALNRARKRIDEHTRQGTLFTRTATTPNQFSFLEEEV